MDLLRRIKRILSGKIIIIKFRRKDFKIMIVILEGLDETGKSTIANYFRKKGFLYLNDDSSQPIKEDKKFYVKAGILSILEVFKVIHNKVDLVIDRFHLTEFVYGIINRDYSASYIFDVDKELSKLDTRLIYMTDDITLINSRANKDLSFHKIIMDACFAISTMRKHKFNLKFDDKFLLLEWMFGQQLELFK